MRINAAGDISLTRTIYTGNGVDTIRSGAFRGTLSQTEMAALRSILAAVAWEKIEFPGIRCCDAPIVQIILTVNNKYMKFKSMVPPEAVKETIACLKQLALHVKWPPYKGAIDFEWIAD